MRSPNSGSRKGVGCSRHTVSVCGTWRRGGDKVKGLLGFTLKPCVRWDHVLSSLGLTVRRGCVTCLPSSWNRWAHLSTTFLRRGCGRASGHVQGVSGPGLRTGTRDFHSALLAKSSHVAEPRCMGLENESPLEWEGLQSPRPGACAQGGGKAWATSAVHCRR